jgi:hypothetical protein
MMTDYPGVILLISPIKRLDKNYNGEKSVNT